MIPNGTNALTLADIDCVLSPEYDIVSPGDPCNENHHALRAVRHNVVGHLPYFSSVREYFVLAVSVTLRVR